jgi:hypothetical protein
MPDLAGFDMTRLLSKQERKGAYQKNIGGRSHL